MRIAYVIYPEAMVLGAANGIRSQAVTWAESMADRCDVTLVSPWDNVDWASFDVVHLFGGQQWLGFVGDLKARCRRIVFSPILDLIDSRRRLKILASLRLKGLPSQYNLYKTYLRSFDAIYVRSEYEAAYCTECFGVPRERLKFVSISFDLTEEQYSMPQIPKEDFCLHISALFQPRKNVLRLIEAANRYRFPLVLCGNTGDAAQTQRLRDAIGDNANIQLRGYVSDAEAFDLYRRAAVFALPSVNEGVGIVALNAAAMGANIVITNVGGPREYFGGLAREVSPYDTDAIGSNIVGAFSAPHDEALRNHVISNYSRKAVADRLLESYRQLTTR